MREDAEFYLGYKDSFFLKKALVKEARVHKSYIEGVRERDEAKQKNYDIAIVKIDEFLGDQEGYASLKVFKENDLKKLKVNITGYPSPGTSQIEFQTYVMYTMEGEIKKVDPYRIHYDIDTSSGQSGSGVWLLRRDNGVDCLGVHAYGRDEEDRHNSATRINEDHFNMIENWLKKMKS